MLKRYIARRDNPWEILVIAALFFFPGVFIVLHRGPLFAVQQTYRYTYMSPGGVTALSERGAHLFGALAIAVGVVFFWFYFYLRRLIAQSRPHIVEHGHERI
jgi:hypothetical protein